MMMEGAFLPNSLSGVRALDQQIRCDVLTAVRMRTT